MEMQVPRDQFLRTGCYLGKKEIWSGSRSREKGCPAQSLDRFPQERGAGQKSLNNIGGCGYKGDL